MPVDAFSPEMKYIKVLGASLRKQGFTEVGPEAREFVEKAVDKDLPTYTKQVIAEVHPVLEQAKDQAQDENKHIADIHAERSISISKKDASLEKEVEKDLPGVQQQKTPLSQDQLRSYYKNMAKELQKTSNGIIKELQNIGDDNAKEKEALAGIATALGAASLQMDERAKANQQQIQREVQEIEKIKEHEKKKEERTLGGELKKHASELADAFLAILLPPEWYDALHENDKGQGVENKKGANINKDPHDVAEKMQKTLSKSASESLGALTPPPTPEVDGLSNSKSEGMSASFFNSMKNKGSH